MELELIVKALMQTSNSECTPPIGAVLHVISKVLTKEISRITLSRMGFQVFMALERCNSTLDFLVESLRSMGVDTAAIVEGMDVGSEDAKRNRHERVESLETECKRRFGHDVVLDKDKSGRFIGLKKSFWKHVKDMGSNF